MKTTRFHLLLPFFLPLVAPCAAQTGNADLPRRNAATHEELSALRRQAVQNDPVKSLKPSEGADPTKVNQPSNIVSQSDFVCYNGMVTLVPKRAVIYIPPKLKDRMAPQPGALLYSWPEFFAANRGWITAVEVSRAQAEGRQPLTEDTVKQMGKSANLMVATYKGGPISVLPPIVPEETADTIK